MRDIEQVRAYFAGDKYATETTGIVIEEADVNYARCSLKLRDGHMNARGFAMGGVMFTLADFVFAIATNYENCSTVTVVSQITYLSAAKGDTLYGESKLIKDGKRNCYFDILITDNLGTNVAKVSVTGAHV